MDYRGMQHNTQNLTTKQKAIVVDSTYPKYRRAGAGTGKTQVLVQKILHILTNDHDCALENFGIITFTNKATDEMRERLRASLYSEWMLQIKDKGDFADYMRNQAEQVSMVQISTIHDFCEKFLRQYGLHIGLPLNFKIKSFRREISEIIADVVSRQHGEIVLSGIPQHKITRLIDILLTNNSNRGIAIDSKISDWFVFDTQENSYWNEFKAVFLTMYVKAFEMIERLKHEKGIITANDMIRLTVELLKNSYVANKISNRFKYIFIDEFQDTNKDQFDLVNLLIKEGVKVFLVGDDKQSIYAFRGADVQNSNAMYSMIRELADGDEEDIYLDENFRTDDELLEIINKIFAHNFTFRQKEIKFPCEPLQVPENKEGNSIPDCFKIEFGRDITATISDILANTKIKGCSATYGDIAILCRRNYDLGNIAVTLKTAGLPVEVVGGRGFYRTKEIIDTFKLFNAVLNVDSQYRKELIFTDYYTAIKKNSKHISFKDYITELEVIFRRETVEEILTFMYEKSFISEYYYSVKNYQAVSNLQKLKDISRNLMSKENMQPLQFLEYLNIMISTSQDEDEADITQSERDEGVISLYSIHKAKGLAFPIVIVPCIDNKLNRPITQPKIIFDPLAEKPVLAFAFEVVNTELPPDKDYDACIDDEITLHLQEEIRVFYVACTRAKHQLVLCGSKSYGEAKASLGWRDYMTISKWLAQIDDGEFIRRYTIEESNQVTRGNT